MSTERKEDFLPPPGERRGSYIILGALALTLIAVLVADYRVHPTDFSWKSWRAQLHTRVYDIAKGTYDR